MRFALIIAACGLLSGGMMSSSAQETVTFQTEDGVTILADWYPADSASTAALVLLHMNRSNRATWKVFAPVAVANGFHVLAIDLRGHGESTSTAAGALPFDSLGPKDYQAMTRDVDAAVGWLFSRIGTTDCAVGLIGASIGANVALNYASSTANVRTVVLLSPGLDYRGVESLPSLKRYGDRPVLIMSAEDDNYSAVSSRAMAEEGGAGTELFLYPSGGHGTYLFETQSDLTKRLIDYMKMHLAQP